MCYWANADEERRYYAQNSDHNRSNSLESDQAVDLRPGVALLADIQYNAGQCSPTNWIPYIWGPRVSDPWCQCWGANRAPWSDPGTHIVYPRHMLAYSLFMRLAYWQAGPYNCNEAQMMKLLFLPTVDVLRQIFWVKPLLLLLCERCVTMVVKPLTGASGGSWEEERVSP